MLAAKSFWHYFMGALCTIVIALGVICGIQVTKMRENIHGIAGKVSDLGVKVDFLASNDIVMSAEKYLLYLEEMSDTLKNHIAHDTVIPSYYTEIIPLLAIAHSIDNSYLNNQDAIKVAMELCDAVYRASNAGPPLGAPRVDPPAGREPLPQDVYIAYQETMKEQKISDFYCQGRSWILRQMLEAKGIPAREVALFRGTVTRNLSIGGHNSLEFYDGTKWLAIDPSFAIMFKISETGSYASYIELHDAVASGMQVEHVFIGKELIRQQLKTIEDFESYFNCHYNDFFNYVLTQKSIIHYDTVPPLIVEHEVRPVGWDGVVDIATDDEASPVLLDLQKWGLKVHINR